MSTLDAQEMRTQSMRAPLILLALAVAACSNDRMADPPAARLVLTPDSARIDTAGAVQVQSTVVWSDGAEHPATVTYVASGGTISTTGLFTAGATAGRYLVIAACTCGLSDTAAVIVGSQSAPSTMASLVISASGLPTGTPAQLSVTGPGGFRRDVSTPITLDSLQAGDYSLQAAGATVGVDLYAPVRAAQSISLAAADAKNIEFVYARVGAPTTTLPAHPRVWLNPTRVAFVQAQAAANTVRWQRVKAAADAQVLKGAVYSGGDEVYLGHLCLSYLGTGNSAYSTRAGAILTAYAVETNNLEGDSGYPFRFNLPLVTMGLDWCYGGLTVAQRHQAATWLMNRADWVWPETNPATTAYGVRDVKDNYFWGFMMTGPAALAAAGDDAGVGAVSGSDRAAYHQALALTKWNGMALPYFNSVGAGGAWSEGTGYGVGDAWYSGRFADAFLTTGQPLDNPAFSAEVRWLLHSTMPGGKFKIPFGDQARVSTGPMYTYDRIAMLDVLPSAKVDGTLAAQAQAWLNLVDQAPAREIGVPSVLTDELLHYDPAQSSAGDLSSLPKGYLEQGDGALIYRQSWTDPNATVMAFRSGPTGESHSGEDANSLRIWKGSFWISADANIYSASGIQQTTDKFNSLTVGGVGQSHHDGAAIVASQISDTLVAVRGQAKDAYYLPGSFATNRSSVSDYLRTVVYLPQQDLFVIVDRATIVDATKTKVWHWQVKNAPQVSGNTFRLSNAAGDAQCQGSVLAPTDVALGTETFALGSGGAVSSYGVTVTLPPRASDVVVTFLQCSSGFAASIVPTVTTNATETMVTFGTKRVVVPLSESQPVQFESAAVLRNP
jgi:hypothetical protein